MHISRDSLLTLALAVGLGGCHNLTDNQLPAGTQDPSYYNNAAGALGMRNAAVFTFGQSLTKYIINTGLLTDELTDPSAVTGSAGTQGGIVTDPLDERILPELENGSDQSYPSDVSYGELQGARTGLLQAIGQLAKYDSSTKDTTILTPAASRALRGELYALYGYTEIMLADLFCSGIPLSTLDFQHDITYRAGSTTVQVYQDAIAHFDTALALSGDSARIQYLARVGQGRAYLDVGNLNAAVHAVQGVPVDFVYQLLEPWENKIGSLNYLNEAGAISNREGENGLPYVDPSRNGLDPRTMDTMYTYGRGASLTVYTAGMPWKYEAALQPPFTAQITIASGVEAQLIMAEAAQRSGDASWLTILNSLRTTGNITSVYTRLCVNGITSVQTGSPCPDSVTAALTGASWKDTTWSPGTGINLIPLFVQEDQGLVCPQSDAPGTPCTDTVWYRGLRPLSDPGVALSGSAADSARLALIFHERAAWLYMTGSRQGDLRRQLRTYSPYWRGASRSYPSGIYLGLGAGNYGSDVNAPIPTSEDPNPLFHGCLNRDP